MKRSLVRPVMAGLMLLGALAASTKAQAKEYMTPVKEHELLAKDVGVWDAEVSMWEKPDGEPMMSKAKETNKMLGKMWLLSIFEGEFGGQPFTGHSALGYDPKKEKYTGGWIDTMSPFMMPMEGEYDEESKTLTMHGEATDCMTGEDCKMKLVTTWDGEDEKTFEMHKEDDDGKTFKTMEIKYTRQK